MANFVVDDEKPVALRRPAGITIQMVNQNAVDVYFSAEREELVTTPTGAVPNGLQLAKAGGQLQYPNFPGVLWFRAAAKTSIQVVP